MPPVQVSVNSDLPSENQSFISFSIPDPVSGVTASGPELIFAPGFYEVTIHLPPGLGGAGLVWQTQPPPPSGGISKHEGETSVTFGLDNSGTDAAFGFNLTFETSSRVSHAEVGPTIVSDPPPSVEFRSS